MTDRPLRRLAFVLLLLAAVPARATFVTFESGQVRPLALSPDGTKLFAVNTPGDRLEVFTVDGTGGLTHAGSVPVGLEPVAVAARSNAEVWVVNHLSDSVSIVDVATMRVTRTLLTCDEPHDIVFAQGKAFVTTARRGQPNTATSPTTNSCIGAGGVAIDPKLNVPGTGRALVQVFDPTNFGSTVGGTPVKTIELFGDTPRALAVSPGGDKVYAAVFESGNRTATISELGVCDDTSSGNNVVAGQCTINGASIPGGTPNPDTNVQTVKGPEVGLIVKFQNGHWVDRGVTAKTTPPTIPAQGPRAFDPVIKFDLPDEDVFVIDAATLAPPASGPQFFTGVGTILFNMVTNPATGKVYVTNTDARNDVRFEGPGIVAAMTQQTAPPPLTVRGHLAETRVTVLDPTSGSVAPRHLNKHLDTAASYAQPGTGAKDDSLSTPLGMAIDSTGTALYVAAFGSSKIGIFSVSQLEADTFVPTIMNQIPVTGGGPSGLVLNEAKSKLYVFTRFDNAISVIDTGSNLEGPHIPLLNPEPASVKNGRRFLYDSPATSSNGEASCASCHIFGDFDSLAWDLGNPDDNQLQDNNTFEFNLGCPASFHPIKGPMTTQTLRGMANNGPMHWRGDRSGANNPGGNSGDENAAFNRFIIAFDGLLGRGSPDAPVSTTDMQKFADFILQVMMPPNPIRALDNSLTSDQATARGIFTNPNRLSDTIRPCAGCHTLNPANGNFGTQGFMSFEGEVQCFKVPQLRNMYQKVGMFGMAQNSQIKASPNTQGPNEFGPKGPQVRGFGFLHDGSVDRLFHFHRANVFDLTETEALQMEQFMMAFDTNFAPIVGQQITLTSTNSGTVGPRIDLMIARAALNECDLVVKGNLSGVQRGWLRQANGSFKSDKASESPIADGGPTGLRAKAGTAGQELTYTCVPPSEGQRVGIDRDLDGCLDADDLAPDDPTTCGVVGTTTTSTTIPGATTTTTTVTTTTTIVGATTTTTTVTTTTTIVGATTTSTTNPGGCTAVPVTDLKANVRVNTHNERGQVSAKMVIDLASYASEPVTVTLSDIDTPTIATQAVGGLPPSGLSGRKWQFKTTLDGVQRVSLKNLAPNTPGKMKLQVKTKHWFSSAAANQPAPNTSLTVQIGNLCFTHVATRKVD
jgi:YVTN family beta-propeller protein